MISGSTLLTLLVSLVIAGLVFWIIWWFLDYVAIPEPFNKVIRVVVGLAVVIFLIDLLMGLNGHPLIR
jgi:ABC-type multidrug transport system permease subunit